MVSLLAHDKFVFGIYVYTTNKTLLCSKRKGLAAYKGKPKIQFCTVLFQTTNKITHIFNYV